MLIVVIVWKVVNLDNKHAIIAQVYLTIQLDRRKEVKTVIWQIEQFKYIELQ